MVFPSFGIKQQSLTQNNFSEVPFDMNSAYYYYEEKV